MDLFLKIGIVVTPSVFLTGAYLIARKWNIGRHASISAHGGQSSETLRLFGGMTIVLALWYYSGWLFLIAPNVSIPYFPLLFTIATICIILISFIPARPSIKSAAFIHTSAATILGIVMIALALGIATNPTVVSAARYGFWAFIVYSIVMLPAYAFIPFVRRNGFIVEAIGIVLFAVSTAIVAITV